MLGGCVAVICSLLWPLEDPSLASEGRPSLLPLSHPWPSTLQLPWQREKVREGIQILYCLFGVQWNLIYTC